MTGRSIKNEEVIESSNAVKGRRYTVLFPAGTWDGLPAIGRYVGERGEGGNWQVWKEGGGHVMFGVRDHELTVVAE